MLLYVDHNCDVITNFCVLRLMGFKRHVAFLVKKKGGGKEGKEAGERERREERKGFHFIRGYLSCIVHVNFEGRWLVTQTVKGSKLIVVNIQSWDLSFIIVGIFIQKYIMHLSSHILN